jgi:hypothetical protein
LTQVARQKHIGFILRDRDIAAHLGAARAARCDEPMHLLRIEPHPRFANLDERFFRCQCGEEIREIVVRRD